MTATTLTAPVHGVDGPRPKLVTAPPLSPPGAPRMPLRLVRNDRTFPDGSVELIYAPG
jgi:hypothetical protein